jgi:hypothetical protein
MPVVKLFLTLVGFLYLALSLWCSLSPEATSQKVGFERIGDTGRSEFLTVYGGLEFGLALVFLLPWFSRGFLQPALWSCMLIHGSLVGFRTISFALFPNVSSMTYQLAAGEWVIFLVSLLLLWFTRGRSDETNVQQPA